MRIIFFSIIAFFSCFCLQGQTANGFGFKGGLNYNTNGNYFESAISAAENPDGNIGFHFGVFAKFGGFLFAKPELVFTSTKSDYEDGTFKMQKIDAPLLGGIRVLKFLNVFAGPSFQYIIDSDFDNRNIDNIENDITVGLNIGVGFSLKKIGIDLRYERGFSSNEATIISDNGINIGTLDTRPEQLILSLSFVL